MIDRRTFFTVALAAVATPVSTRTVLAQAGMSRVTAYAFSFPALVGGDIRLADYAGRPLLVVNTASLCGFTPQYAGLQELWTEFRDRGLMMIGVPSNDFGGQEPGGATEGCAALELSQISGRPKWLHRRGVPSHRRTVRYANQNRHWAGARGDLTRGLPKLTQSAGKSCTGLKSRCRGGAAATRL